MVKEDRSLNRLNMRDPRFARAARIFRSERADRVDDARQLLRELLQEGWTDYQRREVRELPEGFSLEDLREVLKANDGNATAAARALGVHPRLLQRRRAELLGQEEAA